MLHRKLPKLRYSLGAVFFIVGLFAVLFLGLRHWRDNRPVEWEAYSDAIFTQHVNDDRPVLILVGADWDMNSLVVKGWIFKDLNLVRTLNRKSVILYYADLTDIANTPVKNLLRRHGRNSTPTVLIYPNGVSGNCVVFDGIPKPDEIAQLLMATPIKPTGG